MPLRIRLAFASKPLVMIKRFPTNGNSPINVHLLTRYHVYCIYLDIDLDSIFLGDLL